MELQAILDWYDADQRRDAVNHGTRREVTGTVVRYVAMHEPRGYVTYSQLAADTADEAIRREVDYFARLGQAFEWTAYSHDSPPDLRERLLRHGFEAEETEAIMILEVDALGAEPAPPPSPEVRRIRDPGTLADVFKSRHGDAANTEHGLSLTRRLQRELQEIPDRLSVYVAYCDGVPACSGWIRFDPVSPFASLWGGATRPEFRMRGLYTALVAARAQEARERGARFLTVDAQSMSQPILEKRGFRPLTLATPMMWRPPPPVG